MNVIFAVIGQIVIEHDLDVVHVNAARGNVGGNEKFEPDLRNLPITRSRCACVMSPCKPVGHVALRFEMVHQLVHHALGVCKK